MKMKKIFTIVPFLLLFSVLQVQSATVFHKVDTTFTPIQVQDTIINTIKYIDSQIYNLSNSLSKQKWYPYKEKLILKSIETTIQLTNNSTFVLYNDDSLIVAEHSPIFLDDTFWIPVTLINKLNPLFKHQFDFTHFPNISFNSDEGLLAINVSNKSNGTLIELEFSKPFSFDNWYHKPHYILRINGLKLNPEKWNRRFKSGIIRKIIAVKEEKLSQITFEVNHLAGDIELIKGDNSKKIKLLFRRKEKSSNKNTTKSNTKKIMNIIIDAGHGGKDPGAHGLKYNESDITLKVALELKKILLKKGLKPKLTRDTDEYLTLKERPKFATDNEGDMFISLHCNAIPGSLRKKKRVRGFKIYILREAKSDDDKAIARRENAAISEVSNKMTKKEITPVEWILLEHQLNLFSKESELLAGTLVESMSENMANIRKHGYGAGQAGFYVLVGAFMPAVLVEMGFISNPKEEVYMQSKKGTKEIARSITKAIMAYKKEVEKH